MHYIIKFGIDEHRKFKEIDQKNYLEHLLGKVNFVLQIKPIDLKFIGSKAILIDLKKKQELKTKNIEPLLK